MVTRMNTQSPRETERQRESVRPKRAAGAAGVGFDQRPHVKAAAPTKASDMPAIRDLLQRMRKDPVDARPPHENARLKVSDKSSVGVALSRDGA
jgi:hypothetical protein